jgi:CHAT domain-containing protein
MWWCPTGAFTELPLHAAGVYDGPDQDCLANYVVSSYTPTISALINAQEQMGTTDSDVDNVLVVSVPEPVGHSSLPNALVEADLVRCAVPSNCLNVLSRSQASISNVLQNLPDAAVFHMACHGHQSQDDPLTSGFSLHDGRLKLEQLMQIHLSTAKLAYLSACETASTDEWQPDEAINLASTMLFVGFKSVIATMWYVVWSEISMRGAAELMIRSMDDLDGPFIAERVYRAIFREGKLNLAAVPHALDAAVRELRETGAHPSRWATYVHIGA